MLAGSLLAAIADARAWRSWWGWASSPALAARWAKARLAWLGLTGVPRSVRKTRSSSTGWGGWPGSMKRSPTVVGWPQGQAETVLVAAVTAQRLDREGWQEGVHDPGHIGQGVHPTLGGGHGRLHTLLGGDVPCHWDQVEVGELTGELLQARGGDVGDHHARSLRARRSAVARPMPEPAPVTIAVRPAKRPGVNDGWGTRWSPASAGASPVLDMGSPSLTGDGS